MSERLKRPSGVEFTIAEASPSNSTINLEIAIPYKVQIDLHNSPTDKAPLLGLKHIGSLTGEVH